MTNNNSPILGSYYFTTMPKSWAWARGVMVAQADRHPAGAGSIPAESMDFGTKPHPARKGGIGVLIDIIPNLGYILACD